MKILLFGGSGQLGFEITKRARDLDFEVISPVTSEVNVTERDQVIFLMKQVKPTVVINCAAYTAVDKAEADREAAYRVNRDGPAYVAEGVREIGARLIHISTDYVFDGSLGRALNEEDATNPLSVYGKSKLAGEDRIRQIAPDSSLIVRTSSLHGQRGINFVHTMIKLFRELSVVKVVSDQTMSPTWAGWLAEALLDVARMDATGVVHASCEGAVTWHQFAREIYENVATRLARTTPLRIEETTAESLNRPAKRPVYSPFDTTKLSKLLGRRPISWQEGLRRHLMEIPIE